MNFILSDLIFLFKYPALVPYYSEGAGAAAAFLCVLLGKNPSGMVTINRGKLLQHKLIHVQCTKKSTQVPVLFRTKVIAKHQVRCSL